MRFLTVEDVLAIHASQLERFGGGAGMEPERGGGVAGPGSEGGDPAIYFPAINSSNSATERSSGSIQKVL